MVRGQNKKLPHSTEKMQIRLEYFSPYAQGRENATRRKSRIDFKTTFHLFSTTPCFFCKFCIFFVNVLQGRARNYEYLYATHRRKCILSPLGISPSTFQAFRLDGSKRPVADAGASTLVRNCYFASPSTHGHREGYARSMRGVATKLCTHSESLFARAHPGGRRPDGSSAPV